MTNVEDRLVKLRTENRAQKALLWKMQNGFVTESDREDLENLRERVELTAQALEAIEFNVTVH